MQTSLRNRSSLLLLVVAVVAGLNCAALRKVTEPLTGLVKRGSCISIDLPPITLTPERTAAERQLVGENRQLEPNGWLLASSRSTARYGANGRAGARALPEVRRLYRELAVLEYYEEFQRELQGRGALGETTKGTLALVPASVLGAGARRVTRSDRRRAETVAEEVNQARRWIYEYHKRRAAKEGRPAQDVFARYVRVYWELAPVGTWVRDAGGRWNRRQ